MSGINRLVGGLIVICAIVLPSFVAAQQELFKPMVDVTRSLQAWSEEVEEPGLLTELPKSAKEGDLFDKAYANAQYQVAKPALDALRETHKAIADRCDGRLAYKDVSDVFAQTDKAETYFRLMNRREIVDEIDKGDFQPSCQAVYKCYFESPVDGVEYDVEDAAFSQTTFSTCQSIVDQIFTTMLLRTSSLENIRNVNYGDEFYSNAKAEDAPYDLLLDIEEIGNLLFRHNDPASEIHLYEMTERIEFVDNFPQEVTSYEVEQPNRDQDDPTKRLPPANSSTPLEPDLDEVGGGAYPSDGEPLGIDILEYDTPPAAPSGTQGGLLQNPICEEPEPDETSDEDPELLEYAQEEFTQTKTYNDDIDLENNVAIALLGKIAPELEEQYGLDDILPPPPPDVSNQVAELMAEIDLKGEEEAVKELKSQFRACVEQMVDNGDANVMQKQVWRTITQPTRLTECIMQASCRELTDKSGRGLYRFRVCKVPTKKYDVAAYQPVYSIEQVVDEISNVCIGLKESGQLIEHNRTKDHWDHKLMRVNLGDKFSFGISVGIVPLRDEVDIAAIKRLEVQRNAYLEDVILDFSPELTTLTERNKYLVVANPNNSLIANMPGEPSALSQRANTYNQITAGTTDEDKDEQSQLSHYGEILDVMDQFIEDNSKFRGASNDYMSSLNQKWQATYEEFKNAPGQ